MNIFIIIFSASLSIFVFILLYVLFRHSASLKPRVLKFYENGGIFKNRGKNSDASNGFGGTKEHKGNTGSKGDTLFDAIAALGENAGFGGSSFASKVKLLFESRGRMNILGFRIKTIEEFYILKIILSVSVFLPVLVAGFFLSINLLLYAALAATVFYFLPSEIVKGKINNISKKILIELPEIIDLMASLIKAGLTIDETIVYIFKNLSGEIPGLFRIYNIKILEGAIRREAFDSVGKMSYCAEFYSFIKIIYQSEVIGNPIKEVLKDLSRVYRNNQRDNLKMRAEKLESNLILVIFIFIFIPMLLIFLMPVLPQLKIIIG
jgi:tight adherence protein C